MRPRQGAPLNAAFRNPTVIGALTVLITILTVFLAYNANNGLPFVQSYRLTAQVPNAEALVPGNEVRIGGVRVGVVEEIRPVSHEEGTTTAALSLKLDKSVEGLPNDSTVVIRARSALGLKYVQIVRGTADGAFAEGATMPLRAARPEPVEIDELFSTFDEPTRRAIRGNLTEFGNALAGRGPDLNEAIGAFEPLLPRLERVMRTISSPNAGIASFFRALEQSASEVAPVAEAQAQMFVELDTTITAFADVARPFLQDTISKTPETLRTTSETLPRIRPFLVNSRGLFVDLQPGTAALASSADTIESALLSGIPVLQDSPTLNNELAPTAASLRGFNDDPDVRTGINRLTDFSDSLTPLLRFVGPSQSVCNYATLLFRNIASTGSRGDSLGNWQRANALNNPAGPNNEGSPSTAPARGGGTDKNNYLHVNPYPNTAAPGQTFECEAGNEGYAQGKAMIGNVPRQPGDRHRGPAPGSEPGGGQGGRRGLTLMAPFSRNRRPKPGVRDFNEGVYHRPPAGLSFFKTGVLALVLILALAFFAYTKKLPWSEEGYTATATFANASTLRKTAPVRIAGVNVGKVTSVEPVGEGAKVTFSVDDEGLPLHDDASITIRPRLFLEGNFFLDLRPGSPSAPALDDGGAIPVTRTGTAVQLDELLTSLQRPDRENLSRLLDGYGSALADKPTAKQDVGQDPDVQGLSGAEAINKTFTYGGRAGKGTAQVSQALLGQQAGDLRGLIRSAGTVFGKLASRESELTELVTNFSVTTGAFADESANLQQTLAELAPTVEQAQSQLVDINAAFPPLRAFSRELTPGVKELPATIRAGNPWLVQASQLLQRDELGGLVNDLRIATPDLAAGTDSLNTLFDQLGQTSRCVSNVLVPTGDIVIDDQFRTGATNYKEFLYGIAAQAGEGANFDGNGQFLRIQPGGGPVEVSAPSPVPNSLTTDDEIFGNTIEAPIGSQPPKPKGKPPVKLDVPCYTQDVPSLNGSQAAVGGPSPAATGNSNSVISPTP